VSECRICGVRHDPQTHAAVLRIRAWVRAPVRRVLEPIARPQQWLTPYLPNLNAIKELRCPASREKEKRVRNKSDQR
jgi:hypothetical protein